MAQLVTVEGKIPEDFDEGLRLPEVRKVGEQLIHRRLGLKPDDKVVIKIKE